MKIVNQNPTNDTYFANQQLLTAQQVINGVNSDFRNTSNEIFVGSIGETIADTLKFFNVAQINQADAVSPRNQASMQAAANPKFKEITKVELA